MSARAPTPSGRPGLARRLRELREWRWPNVTVTQAMLAEALGERKPLGQSTIAFWENPESLVTPNRRRLEAYATFFATRRSMEGRPHLVALDELDETERAARQQLLDELLRLRDPTRPQAPLGDPRSGIWRFRDNGPVRIVCGRLPEVIRTNVRHPNAEPLNPDHISLLSYADLDALVELFGHLRAVNPESDVRYLLDKDVEPDDLSTRVVLLGGFGLNQIACWFAHTADLPVQQTDDGAFPDWDLFKVAVNGRPQLFKPAFVDGDPKRGLAEDVGMLVRMPNPHQLARTLTWCTGAYAPGVMGAVRCFTGERLRNRNEAYVASRFSDLSEFGLLMSVSVLKDRTMTPDLEGPRSLLHERSQERST